MQIQTIAGLRIEPWQTPDDGLLYTIPAANTDIRRTFREKYGWVGPEERRNLAEAIQQAASADQSATPSSKGVANG